MNEFSATIFSFVRCKEYLGVKPRFLGVIHKVISIILSFHFISYTASIFGIRASAISWLYDLEGVLEEN